MRASSIAKKSVAPLVALAGACLLSGCVSDRVTAVHPEPQSFGRDVGYDLVRSGRALAVSYCAVCHAIDEGVDSPQPGAPPMNTLLRQLDENDLGNSLVAGLHPDRHHMPAFDFNVVAADALLAYLEAITPPITK